MASNAHGAAYVRLLSLHFKQARKPSILIFRGSSSRRFSSFPSVLSADSATNTTAPPPSPPPKSESPSKTVGLETDVPPSLSASQTLAGAVQKLAPATTETYRAYGVCEMLVKECARQADYTIPQALEKKGVIPKTKDGEDLGVGSGQWYKELGLSPTFNTWAQVTFLHMYALTVRMRAFPAAQVSIWQQHLLDHFFYNAEERMITSHRMDARSIRNKYLKDLFLQWRGLVAGYDEGLARGSDAVLATAVWRNIFKADQEVDLRNLAQVVSYLRGILNGLEGMEDEGIVGGEVVFGDLASQREGVLVKSRMMEGPLEGEAAARDGERDGERENREKKREREKNQKEDPWRGITHSKKLAPPKHPKK